VVVGVAVIVLVVVFFFSQLLIEQLIFAAIGGILALVADFCYKTSIEKMSKNNIL